MKPKFYVVEVFGGVHIELRGPYATEAARDKAAKRYHAKQDEETDSTCWLDIDEAGNATAGSYTGLFFDSGEDLPRGKKGDSQDS